jgi:hypothetical protein
MRFISFISYFIRFYFYFISHVSWVIGFYSHFISHVSRVIGLNLYSLFMYLYYLQDFVTLFSFIVTFIVALFAWPFRTSLTKTLMPTILQEHSLNSQWLIIFST